MFIIYCDPNQQSTTSHLTRYYIHKKTKEKIAVTIVWFDQTDNLLTIISRIIKETYLS